MNRRPQPAICRQRVRTGPYPRFGWLAIIVASSLALNCSGGEDRPIRTEAQPIPVQTERLELTSASDLRTASGTVEPWQRVSPGTKLMGRISVVTVGVGDRVEEEQLLSRLEDADLRAAVDQAQAAIAIAEAQLASASAQYERMTQLAERGSATTRNLEDATSGYQVAKASLQQARANLAAAQATLRYAEVRSPVTGQVVAKNVEAGDMAQPGHPFFTIENTSRVKITAQVPEADIVGLSEGDPARIEIPVLGRILEAQIDRIVPAADTASRTFDVEAHLDNQDGSIKSGMFARVMFPRGKRDALLVPETALIERGQLNGVFVVEEGHARLRWLRLGRKIDDRREVLSGLEPGEDVVLSVPVGLTDGSPVEIDP